MSEKKAYLDLRIWTAELGGSAAHGQSVDLEEMTEDGFCHEIEQAAAQAVVRQLGITSEGVEVESAWYFTEHPCRELVGYQHEDECGEPTTLVAATTGFPARRLCPLRHTVDVDA